MTRVRLSDVAAEAGVSLSTASKVLNGRTDVGAATRAKVLAAAREAGYRLRGPGWPGARSVLVVIGSIDNRYSATVLNGLIDRATSLNIAVVVRPARGEAADPLKDIPKDCVGIVFLATEARAVAAGTELEHQIPSVAIGQREIPSGRTMAVTATNWQAGKTATEHLLGLGHTRIAWLGGAGSVFQERRDGYRAGLALARVGTEPELERNGRLTFHSARRVMREVLEGPKSPTAVVAANDEIAVAAIDAVRSYGSRIPDDISIVGFDDSFEGRWSTPQWTTVQQPLDDMGRMAVSMLLAAWAGSGLDPQQVQLETILAERGSTARLVPSPTP